jgi:hypothetical protein
MSMIAGGQTKDAIRWRQIIGQAITHTRSKTEFERALADLERHLDILLALEKRLKTDAPKSDEALETCIVKAREDVDRPGKNTTLLEAMQAGKVNGGQPIVAAMNGSGETNWRCSSGRRICPLHH